MTARAYPPAMMKLKTAAEYVDMSVAAFEREVAAGRFPQPVMLGKREHWYRNAIDRSLAVLAGDIEPEWDDLKLYGNA